MKVALVHDYLNEFGGAERVLMALAEMWPEAPIYTAFCVPGSSAGQAFKNKKIITSWLQRAPFYNYLYSPLRFLIPWIWGCFDFSGFDLIITSASWYVTKGWGNKFGVKEICYCHTPPRWLYGYQTSVNFQKYWPVKIYAAIAGHFLRMYDFSQAQKVDVFAANSKNVANRIKKFYRRESVVVYPPISVLPLLPPPNLGGDDRGSSKKDGYFLIVSRIVGGKGLELAAEAAKKYGFKLRIAGKAVGFSNLKSQISNLKDIELLGGVGEEEKYRLMAGAKAFLALAKDEDFGITPVESMLCGTPVIAYNGGGYKETVIDGKTGVLFDDYSVEGLMGAIRKFSNLKFESRNLKKWAERFSKERFKKEMLEIVKKYAGVAGD